MTKSYNRSAILRAAWSQAKWIADVVGKPVRELIGTAMRAAWALAKGGPAPAAEMVPQPVQMQQACAAQVETGAKADAPEVKLVLDHTSIEGIRALLIGRSAVIDMPMGEVTYRIVGVRRWTSSDGVQVRDYVDVEDEGMARDDRKGPLGIHIVRAGTSRGVKHDSPVGQVRFTYGGLCNSGAKHGRAERLVADLFDLSSAN